MKTGEVRNAHKQIEMTDENRATKQNSNVRNEIVQQNVMIPRNIKYIQPMLMELKDNASNRAIDDVNCNDVQQRTTNYNDDKINVTR